MFQMFLASSIGAALVAVTGWAHAQVPVPPTVSAPPVAAGGQTPPAATQPKPVPNAVTQAAANAGIRSCLNRVDQFTRFLTAGGQSGVFLFTPPDKANQSIFSASMEVLVPGGSAYASSSFAPVGTDGCGALYETVSWWPSSCADVATQAFAQLRPANKLARNIQVLAGEKTLRVFLMPAGPGCVSIKKEVVF